MPKSRGRRKPAKKPAARSATQRRTARDSVARVGPGAPASHGRYDVGRLSSPTEHIVEGLLLNDAVPPDLLVELLPAMLWLEKATGLPANLCVSSCITLHYAYAELGIPADPRAVDLVVTDQRTDQPTRYGRPDPYWTGSTFHGHCVLWLPHSRRLLDPTVEQYPDVRRHRPGPVCGRITASMATPQQQARLDRGELPAGTRLGVVRDELLLLYTAVDHEFDDVVMSAPMLRTDLPEIRRSARNLAAWALDLLRQDETRDRACRAPYPRLCALLELLTGADARYEDGEDVRFVLRDDPSWTPRRLDELQPLIDPSPDRPARPSPPLATAERPAPATELPHRDADNHSTAIAPTPDSPSPRRGLFAGLRRR